jgi:hypothetical protein
MKTIPAFKLTAVMSIFDNIDWDHPTAVSNKPRVY